LEERHALELEERNPGQERLHSLGGSPATPFGQSREGQMTTIQRPDNWKERQVMCPACWINLVLHLVLFFFLLKKILFYVLLI
jgi:hypothetical protein